MRKSSVTIFFALCVLFTSGVANAAQETLRVGVEIPYPPFAYYDANGVLTGFDIEIATALCAELGRKCEFKHFEFDNLLPALAANDSDMVVAGLAPTEERKKLVDFTDKYFRSHSIFIERAGAATRTTPEMLAGKKIGVQQGTTQSKYLEKFYPQSIVAQFENFDDTADALIAGELTLMLVDGLAGYELLKSKKGSGLELAGDPISSDLLIAASHIAVRKGNDKLRESLNEAIRQIREKGVYGKINRKYFDFNVY